MPISIRAGLGRGLTVVALVLAALPLHAAASGPAAPADATSVFLPAVMARTAPPLPAGQVYHVPVVGLNSGNPRLPEMAVFWFGQVTPTHNSVDVRLGYTSSNLYVNVAVIDRLLWHDNSPDAANLTDWDAVSLYLYTGVPGGGLNPGAYRLVAQAGSGPAYQRAERGSGAGWAPASVPFTTALDWRGNAFNDAIDDDGWMLQYTIPFASLGLAGPPANGASWALAVEVHDRDDAAGTPIAATRWPAALGAAQPDSWGRIAFGLPVYTPPAVPATGSVMLRHGVNGVSVPDQHAGGGTTCAEFGHNKWTAFGTRVWNGAPADGFVNVQNQRDVSDFPCFSRYYVTFPLAGRVPAGSTILAATLTLHLTGGSGQIPCQGNNCQEPSRSLIQALVVDGPWDPNTLSWNNSPQALQNVSRTQVEPHPSFPGWPGLPYQWDLSYGVAWAMANGAPELRLALYSADAAIHSGKYFAPSETGVFSQASRPTLTITWAAP